MHTFFCSRTIPCCLMSNLSGAAYAPRRAHAVGRIARCRRLPHVSEVHHELGQLSRDMRTCGGAAPCLIFYFLERDGRFHHLMKGGHSVVAIILINTCTRTGGYLDNKKCGRRINFFVETIHVSRRFLLLVSIERNISGFSSIQSSKRNFGMQNHIIRIRAVCVIMYVHTVHTVNVKPTFRFMSPLPRINRRMPNGDCHHV